MKTLAWRLLLVALLIAFATVGVGAAVGMGAHVLGQRIVLVGAILALTVLAAAGLCLLVSFFPRRL